MRGKNSRRSMATEDRKNLFKIKASALSFPLLFYEARQKRAVRKKYS
jgi:hypothetical protein